MRRGFLIAMLGIGALVVFALILVSPRGGRTSTDQAIATNSSDDGQTAEAPVAREINFAGPIEPAPELVARAAPAKEKTQPVAVPDGQDEANEGRVAERIEQLRELSTKTDRASLETLLSEVRNTNQEIREAALDAISQSGNREAIPGLREAEAQTEDSREKQAIVDVIEFISLPTLTEVVRGQGGTNSHRPR